MEEESKMSFWKKCKTSVIGLEEYQNLAIQKITKTIGYLAIVMLIFAFFVTLSITYRFHGIAQDIISYIDENIEELTFKNGVLSVKPKVNQGNTAVYDADGKLVTILSEKENENDGKNNTIIIDETNYFNGKIIVDTQDITEEQFKTYENEIKSYTNGILILKDKVIVKTIGIDATLTFSLKDIAEQTNLMNIEKKDLVNFVTGSQMYQLDVAFFIAVGIGIYINFLATTLLDVILYSIIAYTVGICTRIRLKYSAAYNIAAYSLTLPIILNLIYAVVNILTGYTITYFSIMYMAIACIYIITAILMIKSDVIKKQMELSKIIEEQERVKQEIARKEQEEKEEAERQKRRNEDEKRRKEEKKKQKEEDENQPSAGGQKPEPQANIKPSNS